MKKPKNPDRVKLGRASRNKGKRWERAVASDFRAVLGDRVRRGWQSRLGDDEADNEGIPLLWVECKHGKGASGVRAALAQAEAATDGRRPIAFCKDDRQRHWRDARLVVAMATMYAHHWEELLVVFSSVLDENIITTTVTGKRVNIPRKFLAHAEAVEIEHGRDAIAMLVAEDDGGVPIIVMEYRHFLGIYTRWFDGLTAIVENNIRSVT